MRHIVYYISYLSVCLACLSAAAQTESNFVKSLRTVLQHIPGATKILSMDLKSDVDGQLTAALSDKENKVSVVFQNGTKWKVLQPAEDFKSQASILLYDLDRDGKSELVIGSDRIRVYSLRSQQLDLLWQSESLFGFDTPAPRVQFGDFNKDGSMDLVVLNYKDQVGGVDQEPNQQSLYLFEQHPSAADRFELKSTLLLTDKQGFHSTAGLVVSNFVADESAEIAVGNDNGFLWLVALQGTELKILHSWEVPSGGAVGNGMCAANIDLDATAELFVGTNGGDVFAFDFVGDIAKPIATAQTGRLAYGVSAADFNSDGIDELVLSRGMFGYDKMKEEDVVLEVYKLTGQVLEKKWSRETADLPRNLVLDIDHDGELEIVVYSLLGNSSSINILRPSLGTD